MLPLVYCILLQWRSCDDTLECLESLQAASYPNLRIVVVDNGTPESCRRELRTRFPAVELLLNDDNLGFSGGNNRGIAYALAQGADYVLVLNNDTVVAPDFLEPLVARLSADRRIGMVGPKIYQQGAAGQLWFAGTTRDWLLGRPLRLRHRGFGRIDRGQYDREQYGDFLSGCAMLLRREVFERVGMFDPAFFAYFEDVDLCLRVRREGYRILYVPAARVYHKAARSSTGRRNFAPLSVYFSTRNTPLLMQRRGCRWGWPIFLIGFGLRLLWRRLRYARQGLPRAGEAMRLGLVDFLRGRLGAGSMDRFT